MWSLSILLLLSAGMGGAEGREDPAPVPTWPEDGRLPNLPKDTYVFLTRDRSTIVVLAPREPTPGVNSPDKVIVRIPLLNDLRPCASVNISKLSTGAFRYEYSISNGPEATVDVGAWTFVVPADANSIDHLTHRPKSAVTPWAGGAASPPIAPQVFWRAAPLGRYMTWFHQEKGLIPPGGTLDGFAVESSFRPGFTTVWFSSGKLVQFDQSWPREIFQQLELLEDRRWRQKHSISVGPMFGPDASIEAITANFIQAIQHLLASGSLDPNSRFVRDVLAALRSDTAQSRRVLAHPQTKVEREIAAAVEMTLGIAQ